MAARRPFWKWHRWTSTGFCPWPPTICIWNFKLNSKENLSYAPEIMSPTDRRTDRQTDGQGDSSISPPPPPPPPTSLGGDIINCLWCSRLVKAPRSAQVTMICIWLITVLCCPWLFLECVPCTLNYRTIVNSFLWWVPQFGAGYWFSTHTPRKPTAHFDIHGPVSGGHVAHATPVSLADTLISHTWKTAPENAYTFNLQSTLPSSVYILAAGFHRGGVNVCHLARLCPFYVLRCVICNVLNSSVP